MKTLSRLRSLLNLKVKLMMNANIIFAPVFALLITGALRVLYGNIAKGEIPEFITQLLLNIGLSFNIGMTGIFLISAMVAEEKENNTLRVLMTSSVTAREFFFASVIPPFAVMIVVNLLLIPISGIRIDGVNLLIYLIISSVAGFISCMIGMTIGIYAKSQVNASTLAMPVLLIITMIPTFASFSPVLDHISEYLFVGIVTEMVSQMILTGIASLSLKHYLVLLGEIILVGIVFRMAYYRNGYEKD